MKSFQPVDAWHPTVEQFDPSEVEFLSHYVTNVDKPVFALINLPEVVKGALFARYSRSKKSLRRLLLDEFREDVPRSPTNRDGKQSRADALYGRVFSDYGDDSIAQLGSVHVAIEGISNVATKLVERGRLMSYLEQSTRYVPYTDKLNGHWKYHTPIEFSESDKTVYREAGDALFSTYSSLLPVVENFLAHELRTHDSGGSEFPRAIRAKSLDLLRGLLPASTRSNVGVYGSGQAYEHLIMRLRSSGNSEAKAIAEIMLQELNGVIPAFLARVDRQDRGILWTRYLEEVRNSTSEATHSAVGELQSSSPVDVDLIDFDPEGEIKIVAAAMYPHSTLAERQLLRIADEMSVAERVSVLRAYVGQRLNRRHRPGRAFERTSYRFDIVGDYGAFRDLQRHRLLTVDWQELSTRHGYHTPPVLNDVGVSDEWHASINRAREVHSSLIRRYPTGLSSYAVPMAFNIRYSMDMNAREAMHVIELRSAAQGHESYRRIVQRMHSLIGETAGHTAVAEAMKFVSFEAAPLERLQA